LTAEKFNGPVTTRHAVGKRNARTGEENIATPGAGA
jgi:hypothetical protein